MGVAPSLDWKLPEGSDCSQDVVGSDHATDVCGTEPNSSDTDFTFFFFFFLINLGFRKKEWTQSLCPWRIWGEVGQ